jgi:hypothetical protein
MVEWRGIGNIVTHQSTGSRIRKNSENPQLNLNSTEFLQIQLRFIDLATWLKCYEFPYERNERWRNGRTAWQPDMTRRPLPARAIATIVNIRTLRRFAILAIGESLSADPCPAL